MVMDLQRVGRRKITQIHTCKGPRKLKHTVGRGAYSYFEGLKIILVFTVMRYTTKPRTS